MTREFVCIVCPNGCRLTAAVDEKSGEIAVTGNLCPRGAAFAQAELTCPMRSLTTTVRTVFPDRPVLPVRTAGELPKDRIAEAMCFLAEYKLTKRVRCGDTVIANLLGTGVKLIATDTIEA
ncbi:MAG: DUF1667 domain-containing protein [Oscillospiraceae bacterium]|nr:DUF1667 domain-containing protein [Oscillospiraceae bacterium]